MRKRTFVTNSSDAQLSVLRTLLNPCASFLRVRLPLLYIPSTAAFQTLEMWRLPQQRRGIERIS